MSCDTFSGKEIYSCFWEPVDEFNKKHKCKYGGCGAVRTQNLKNGYSNLKDHIVQNHLDWREMMMKFKNQGTLYGPMNKYLYSVGCKAKNIYGWISWVIDENLPFAFVEKKNTRKYSSLKETTPKTLKKYMQLLQKKIRSIITTQIPSQFGIVIDGWTLDSEHYSCIFAIWFDETTNCICEVLLSCHVADDIHDKTEFVEDIVHGEKNLDFQLRTGSI